MALLVISSLGCLGLVGKSRWQRSKIETLQRQLQAASQHPAQARLPETPAVAQAARKA